MNYYIIRLLFMYFDYLISDLNDFGLKNMVKIIFIIIKKKLGSGNSE